MMIQEEESLETSGEAGEEEKESSSTWHSKRKTNLVNKEIKKPKALKINSRECHRNDRWEEKLLELLFWKRRQHS
jgi:hypothetical protein